MSTKALVHRELRPLVAEDLPILQIAAMQGVDIEPLPGSERFMGWCDTKIGFAPIAVIDCIQTDHVVEPHVTWLPWATKKEIYEGFKWFINIWEKTVFLTILKEHAGFYEQCVKRGILRKIGILEVPQAEQEIHMYQRVKK